MTTNAVLALTIMINVLVRYEGACDSLIVLSQLCQHTRKILLADNDLWRQAFEADPEGRMIISADEEHIRAAQGLEIAPLPSQPLGGSWRLQVLSSYGRLMPPQTAIGCYLARYYIPHKDVGQTLGSLARSIPEGLTIPDTDLAFDATLEEQLLVGVHDVCSWWNPRFTGIVDVPDWPAMERIGSGHPELPMDPCHSQVYYVLSPVQNTMAIQDIERNISHLAALVKSSYASPGNVNSPVAINVVCRHDVPNSKAQEILRSLIAVDFSTFCSEGEHVDKPALIFQIGADPLKSFATWGKHLQRWPRSSMIGFAVSTDLAAAMDIDTSYYGTDGLDYIVAVTIETLLEYRSAMRYYRLPLDRDPDVSVLDNLPMCISGAERDALRAILVHRRFADELWLNFPPPGASIALGTSLDKLTPQD